MQTNAHPFVGSVHSSVQEIKAGLRSMKPASRASGESVLLVDSKPRDDDDKRPNGARRKKRRRERGHISLRPFLLLYKYGSDALVIAPIPWSSRDLCSKQMGVRVWINLQFLHP
jgi:hypothetical protein